MRVSVRLIANNVSTSHWSRPSAIYRYCSSISTWTPTPLTTTYDSENTHLACKASLLTRFTGRLGFSDHTSETWNMRAFISRGSLSHKLSMAQFSRKFPSSVGSLVDAMPVDQDSVPRPLAALQTSNTTRLVPSLLLSTRYPAETNHHYIGRRVPCISGAI